MIRAGRLRHRVEIQGKGLPPWLREEGPAATDSLGQPSEEWCTWAKRWAAVEPLQGRERQEALQTKAETTHTVRLRGHGLDWLTNRHRIVLRDRVFEIEQLLDRDLRGYEYTLRVIEREGVAA